MGSVTYNGPIPEDDPRYKEGITILIPLLGIKEISEKSDRSGSQKSTNKQSEKK